MVTRGGTVVSNYIIDATDVAATNAKWTSTTVQTWTVPAGKRWWFIGGSVKNSADATVTVDIYDKAAKVMLGVCSIAAPGAGVRVQYPDADIGYVHRPILLDEGMAVKLTMGAAQGAAAEATCVVLEM